MKDYRLKMIAWLQTFIAYFLQWKKISKMILYKFLL